jgi:integrase/recombinase XerD
MDQVSCFGQVTDHERDDAPFGERNRDLCHCAEGGTTPAVLRMKRNELLWIAGQLGPDARQGVGMDVLERIARQRQSVHGAITAARRVVDIGRPWLRFLGWWREPSVVFQYQEQLDRYVAWMRDERGFTPATVEHLGRQAGRFLRWCEQANRQLGALQATDIDDYFATKATAQVPHLGGQCGVGLAKFSALRGDAGNVLGSSVGGGLPTTALSTGVSALCP